MPKITNKQIEKLIETKDINAIKENMLNFISKYKLSKYLGIFNERLKWYSVAVNKETDTLLDSIFSKLAVMIYMLEYYHVEFAIKQKTLLAILAMESSPFINHNKFDLQEFGLNDEESTDILKYIGYFKRNAKTSKFFLMPAYNDMLNMSIIFNKDFKLDPYIDKNEKRLMYERLRCYIFKTAPGRALYIVYNYTSKLYKLKNKFI